MNMDGETQWGVKQRHKNGKGDKEIAQVEHKSIRSTSCKVQITTHSFFDSFSMVIDDQSNESTKC